jgi:hypothetical protein
MMPVRQQTIDNIHRMAVENFSTHIIERHDAHNDYQKWCCGRKDGSAFYWFGVIESGSLLVVYGDIGFLAVQRQKNMIDWVRRSIKDIHYFAEKVPASIKIRQYDGDVAEEWLREVERAAECRPECEVEEWREKIANLRQVVDDEVSFNQGVYEYGLVDGVDMPDLLNWTPEFLWCREALLWLLANITSEGAS